MTISVTQNPDGTFEITWDENDPQESILNAWTEEDFINAIQNKLQSLEELGEVDNATEAINQVTDYFIDQTSEEVQQDLRNVEAFIRKDEGDDRIPRLFF
jgi:hypothetical protein